MSSTHTTRFCSTLTILLMAHLAAVAQESSSEIVRFRAEQIEEGLTVGYAVRLLDLNEDKKTDILVIDSKRVVWYENPTWKRHTLLDGKTKPDNVCVAPLDVDDDGDTDLVLGADWNPGNTNSGGTLQWLEHPEDPTREWAMYPITEEPTIHRVRVGDLDGDGKKEIILAPLFGRDSSSKANWLNGRPVRILAFRPPANPKKAPWKPEVLSQELHVVHNIWPVDATNRKGNDVLAVSYEGVNLIHRTEEGWETTKIGKGNQDNPKGRRGASEVKMGKMNDGTPFIATIEPWHGHQVVVYTPPKDGNTLWTRHVLDEDLKWGHAVWCADLDGDGGDELVIGVRDDLSQKPGQRRGIRIYKTQNADSGKWRRQLVDQGGVAVEDAGVADLNDDGRIDIVAVGRQTGNAKIYWNLGQ